MLVRETIDRGRGFLPFQAIPVSLVSDQQTSMIRYVLAQGKTPVRVQRIHHDNPVVLLGQFIRALRETSRVISGPPIHEVSVLIIVPPLIIEPMRHLVADHHAYRAIVHRIIRLGVEERGLQDSGGETDLVGGRVIISVYGLRCHIPARLIHRFARVGQLIPHIENVRATHVRPIRITLDLQSAIIAPCIRITDLDRKRGQFLPRFRLGGIAHPWQAIDALAQGDAQIAYQCQHLLLGGGGEILRHVHLANRLSQSGVYRVQRAFPAGLLLLLAGKGLPIELEPGLHEIIAQVRSGGVQQIERQIIFLLIHGDIFQELVQPLVKIDLLRVQLAQAIQPHRLEIDIPIDRRADFLKLLVGHLVVVLPGIPQVLAAIRHLGDSRLDLHHALHRGVGLLRTGARQREQPVDIRLISVAEPHGSLVFQQIIIPVAHTNTRLVQLHDIHRAILLVRPDEQGEEGRHPLFMQGGYRLRYIRLGRDREDRVQLVLDRRLALVIQARAIQAHRVQGAYLLGHTTRLVRRGAQLIDQYSQSLLIIIAQLVERTETRVFRGQWIVLDPSTTSVLVKIRARGHRRIQVRQIDSANGYLFFFLRSIATR